MKERIFEYLKQTGAARPPEEILKHALGVSSPDPKIAERVLIGILQGDGRFNQVDGRWAVAEEATGIDTKRTAALCLEKSANTAAATMWIRGALSIDGSGFEWEFDAQKLRRAPGCFEKPAQQLTDRFLICWSDREIRLFQSLLRRLNLPEWNGDFLSLRRLAGRILDRPTSAVSLQTVAGQAGIEAPDPARPLALAHFLADAFPALLELVPDDHRVSVAALLSWVCETESRLDFSRFAFGRDFLDRLPDSPGVYVMKDATGRVIYVGKSRSLRRRVASYFAPRALREAKTSRIHSRLYSIEVHQTDSEVEALLREMRLIRRFRPPINLQTEIHRRAPSRRSMSNLVLLVPQPDIGKVKVYFLAGGAFMGSQSSMLGVSPSSRLIGKIRTIYFSPGARRIRPRDPWQMEVVYRWLVSHRTRLNMIDIDDAGSLDSAIKRLRDYLSDPDKLAGKVYYR